MRKKTKKQINKLLILFFAFSVLSLYGIPEDNRVRIFIPNKGYLDLSKYKRIVIQQYEFKLPEIKIKYKKVFKDFFVIELKKNIKKEVEFIKEKLIDLKQAEPEALKPDKKIKENVNIVLAENIKSNYTDSLIISIDMALKIDERHVISEEKDKYGDALKSFVKKTVWELKTKIALIDINAEKIVKSFKFTKKLSEEERSTKQYSFKYLFDTTMEEFLKKFQKKGRMERRYLLSLQQKINPPKLRAG